MELHSIVLIVTAAAAVLFTLGVPVILCMGVWASAVLYYTEAFPLANIGQSAFFGLKYFALLAMPLFILTGDLVSAGGISRRLIDFSNAVLRRVPGRTSVSTVGACGLFAAISGSNAATTAAIGRIMIPEMKRRGYSGAYAAAISAAGGTVGVIIPPSLVFILYAVLMNLSAGDLFIAGLLPGVLMMVAMMVVAALMARRNGWDTMQVHEHSAPSVLRTAWDARTGFLVILAALGGIYAGIFSPTEAAGVAVVLCLLSGLLLTRELKVRAIIPTMFSSAAIAGLIAPIVAVSMTLQETLTVIGITESVNALVADVTTSASGVLMLSMAVVFIAGCVLESVPVVIIFAPILAPMAVAAGVDPIHFAVVFVVGSTIGFITPPYGLNLYMAAGISGENFLKIAIGVMPYLIALLGVWLAIAFFPQISLLILQML
ncbi:MAG: TRAP transporter large permease [Burkholderiaceae bacterium]